MKPNFLPINQFSYEKTFDLFLIFNLSEKIYAVPAEKIIEIIQLPALTVIEKFPEYMIGLLNLRGQIINVIDLAGLLGIPQKPYTVDHQILIIECGGELTGIIVDFVSDITQLEKKHLEPLPYKTKENLISGVYRHEDKLIAFLEINSVSQCLKNIDNIPLDEVPSFSVPERYFPTDEESKHKFFQRASKLQEEIRSPSNDLNYQENYFISFSLKEEIYCINLKYVKEITKLKLISLTTVPCVPDFITGIINLRGEFITIVDIKHFLQISKTPILDKTKIIVVRISEMQVGILVDEVFDIENISSEKMNLKVQTKYEKNKYTSAEILLPDNRIMSIFDLRRLLEDERLFIEDAI
jgi:purine-binding chemotaxis protein CheW